MLDSLLAKISETGFAKPKRVLALGLTLPMVFAGLLHEWLRVPGLSLAAIAGTTALEFEILLIRAAARQREIHQCWPIVLESLESAAVSGMSLVESLRDLAESEQLAVAGDFAFCCSQLDSGISFDKAVANLKSRLANPAADFTIELLRLTNELGSAGYISALRNQAMALRSEASLSAELAAKQGWVVGTAKLAVLAPWLIVLVLSFREENAQMYKSLSGTLILTLGLLASAIALYMVYRIGQQKLQDRVFV